MEPPLPAPAKVVERPSPLTGLAHSGIILAASAVMFGREIMEGGLGDLSRFGLVIGIVTGVVVLLAGLYGVIAWRTTTFVADDEEFRIERNLVWSSSSRIDYTKVQSVDVTQPLIARLLGLGKVQIDVGGAGGQSLAFLSLTRAEALREHILMRTRLAQAPTDAPMVVVPEDGVAADWAPPEVADEPIHHVPVPTLLLGTFLSSPSILFAAAAAVVGILTVIFDGSPAAFGFLVAGVGWLWNQLGTNWSFQMGRRGDTLRISRGLTSTTAQGLRPERIQGVAIQQDLLQRLTGLYRMKATVLGYDDPSGEEGGSTKSVILPYGTWADVTKVLGAIWPHVDLGVVLPNPQPDRARWLTPINWWTHTWGVGDDVLVAQHGLFEKTLTVVPHRRMQSVGLSQGPLQRRLRLATVEIHTTDGPVNLRLYHLDGAAARRVFDEQISRGRAARAAAA